MTDRELLELAAKAAGYESCAHPERKDCLVVWLPDSAAAFNWSPLADDGDALRLAVKLRLNITFQTGLGRLCDQEFMQVVPRTLGHLAEFGPIGDDADATIRRAIVRAAAEIGKGMSE